MARTLVRWVCALLGHDGLSTRSRWDVDARECWCGRRLHTYTKLFRGGHGDMDFAPPFGIPDRR